MSKFTFSTGIYILEFFCIDPNRLNCYHWYNQCRHYRTVLFTSRAHKSMQQLQPVINTVTCCTVRLTYFSSPELRSNSSFSILWPFLFWCSDHFEVFFEYFLCSVQLLDQYWLHYHLFQFTNNLFSLFGLHSDASLQYNQYALPTNHATMQLSCAPKQNKVNTVRQWFYRNLSIPESLLFLPFLHPLFFLSHQNHM